MTEMIDRDSGLGGENWLGRLHLESNDGPLLQQRCVPTLIIKNGCLDRPVLSRQSFRFFLRSNAAASPDRVCQ